MAEAKKADSAAQGSTPVAGGAPERAGERQEPRARPYGQPVPMPENTPTVAELHAARPGDAPGAPETPEQYEKRQEREREASLHPAMFPGLHRETPGGPLIPDDERDPGINLNVIS